MEPKITYINHSCFLAELEKSMLLFDYYSEGLTGGGSVPGLPELVDKPLYVFVSHKHGDHFDKRIFLIKELHPDTCYILSKDARMNEAYMKRNGIPESVWKDIHYIGNRDRFEPDKNISVTTLASTDRGAAFLVETEGKRIYHAGDLNWWSWEGETEQRERDMERRFKSEVGRLAGLAIDIAFLPLDSRQGERFYWGFDYFMKHVEVKAAYPMHFWGDRSVIERLKRLEVSEGYRDRIMEI